jgi:hypothetical protein
MLVITSSGCHTLPVTPADTQEGGRPYNRAQEIPIWREVTVGTKAQKNAPAHESTSRAGALGKDGSV